VWSISSGSVALSAHLEIEDLQGWPGVLAAAAAMLQARYGIGHVTLQPETPQPQRTSVIRLWPRNPGS
jgi:cobalt-zinc-cadmium efflux system protein